MKRLLILAVTVAALAACGPATPPPCPTEDSVSCHWDASKQGNGRGRSFTSDEHGVIHFDR